MAFGNANLDSDYVAWAAADLPMIVGRNWLRTSGAVARWTAGTWAADQSDADGQADFGYDEFDHLQTYPSAVGFPDYVINLASGIGEVDSVFILNHNLGTLGATIAVEFCEDQDGLFTPTQTAESQSPSTDKRLAFVDLDHDAAGTQQLYSDVQYMRLHITGLGAVVPVIGEVIIGQRRQLKSHPKLPYEDKRFKSTTRRLVSDSGVVREHVFAKGQRLLSGNLSVHETARISDLDTFYKTEIDYGTLPFLWIDNPNSAPSDAYWMRYDDPTLVEPLIGFAEREFQIIASEQGPNFVSQDP